MASWQRGSSTHVGLGVHTEVRIWKLKTNSYPLCTCLILSLLTLCFENLSVNRGVSLLTEQEHTHDKWSTHFNSSVSEVKSQLQWLSTPKVDIEVDVRGRSKWETKTVMSYSRRADASREGVGPRWGRLRVPCLELVPLLCSGSSQGSWGDVHLRGRDGALGRTRGSKQE